MNTQKDKNDEFKKRIPKKITKKRLENIAIYYLSRYDSSTENLRQILKRRVLKSQRHHEIDSNQAMEWIKETIQKMQSLEYVNDDRYTLNQIRKLWEKGTSKRKIQSILLQKGIPHEKFIRIMGSFFSSFEKTDKDPDEVAAHKYAKRRKLGIYREKNKRKERANKDLASLARAGFSYKIAKEIVEESP
ncbi:MAG: hypothetical protein GY804_03295 [Alphaproteobacteria bacterium]|nr:hypothetical protein [Alphaproteobacteria bacterium]